MPEFSLFDLSDSLSKLSNIVHENVQALIINKEIDTLISVGQDKFYLHNVDVFNIQIVRFTL